jgi:hypothetical protein
MGKKTPHPAPMVGVLLAVQKWGDGTSNHPVPMAKDLRDFLHRDWVLSAQLGADSYWCGEIVMGDLLLTHYEYEEVTGEVLLAIQATANQLLISDGELPAYGTDTAFFDGNVLSVAVSELADSGVKYPFFRVHYSASDRNERSPTPTGFFANLLRALLSYLANEEGHGHIISTQELFELSDLLDDKKLVASLVTEAEIG